MRGLFLAAALIAAPLAASAQTDAPYNPGVLASTLGTAATQNTGTSGHTIPFLDGVVTFSGADSFTAGLTVSGAALTVTSQNLALSSGQGITWNGDVAFCRNGASVLEISATSACGVAGSLLMGALSATSVRNNAGSMEVSSTLPTVTSGFGTSPTVAGTGTMAFTVAVGASGAPSTTLVLAMPSAGVLHGWSCFVSDQTSGTVTGRETASTTASVTFTMTLAPANSDVLQFLCGGN